MTRSTPPDRMTTFSLIAKFATARLTHPAIAVKVTVTRTQIARVISNVSRRMVLVRLMDALDAKLLKPIFATCHET